MKKYALVRVDGVCPTRFECRSFEGLINYYVCDDRKNNKKQSNCNKCLYGDTKEQLIRKVAQVIKRITNDGYVVAYKKFGTGYINTALNIKDVAKEIVEFLGVEE